jgi:hypothetical protein
MILLTRVWESTASVRQGGRGLDERPILVNPAHVITAQPERLATPTGPVAVTRMATTSTTFTVTESLDEITALIQD